MNTARNSPDLCRRGSIIVEAAVAIALLATAMIALTQLAQHSSALTVHADRRAAAQLAADNVLATIEPGPADRWEQRLRDAADRVEATSKCEISILSEPFAAAGREGVHFRIDASPSDSIRVSAHAWRFSAPEPPEDSQPNPDNEQAAIEAAPDSEDPPATAPQTVDDAETDSDGQTEENDGT